MVQQSKCGLMALLPFLFVALSSTVQSQGLIERRSPNPFPSPDSAAGGQAGAADAAGPPQDSTTSKGNATDGTASTSSVPLNGLANSTLSSNASTPPTAALAGGPGAPIDSPLNTTKAAGGSAAGGSAGIKGSTTTTPTTGTGNGTSLTDSKFNSTSTKSSAKSASSHLYGLSSSMICVLNLSVLLVLFA